MPRYRVIRVGIAGERAEATPHGYRDRALAEAAANNLRLNNRDHRVLGFEVEVEVRSPVTLPPVRTPTMRGSAGSGGISGSPTPPVAPPAPAPFPRAPVLVQFNRAYPHVARDLDIPDALNIDVPEPYVRDDANAHRAVDGALRRAAVDRQWDGDVFVYGHSAIGNTRTLSAHRQHWDGHRLGRMLAAHLFRFEPVPRRDRTVMILACYIGQYTFLEEVAIELVRRGVPFGRVEGALPMVSPAGQVPYRTRRRGSIHLGNDPWDSSADAYVRLRDRRPHEGSYTVRTRAGEAALAGYPRVVALRAIDRPRVMRTVTRAQAEVLTRAQDDSDLVDLGDLFP